MGEGLLLVIALGLAGYAIWRILDAITDAEGKGGDAKGIARRLGSAARGLGHGALAVAAFGLATGSSDGGGGDERELASRAVDIAGGSWLLWVAATAVMAYGCYQLYRAYAAKLGSQLDVGAVSMGVGRWVIGLSRVGIAARGIVFGLIGVLLVRAAQHENPQEAGGIRDSLRMLGEMGRWPLAAIALGPGGIRRLRAAQRALPPHPRRVILVGQRGRAGWVARRPGACGPAMHAREATIGGVVACPTRQASVPPTPLARPAGDVRQVPSIAGDRFVFLLSIIGIHLPSGPCISIRKVYAVGDSSTIVTRDLNVCPPIVLSSV